MSSIIRSNERVSASRSSSSASAPRQSASRSTQIQQRESAPVVETTWHGGGGGYQESWGGGEDVSSQYWEQRPYVDLDEAASSDMGSLTRNEEPASQMTTQSESRQEATQTPPQVTVAQTSGLSPSGAAATPAPNRESLSSRVPMVDASPIGDMPVMSSRRPRFDKTTLDEVNEALAESGSQLRAARVTSNGKATPSVTSERTDEATAKPSVLETALRGGTTASSTETDSRQVEQTTFDRPDSVFNRPVGYDPKSRAPRMKRPSTKRPGAVKDAMKNVAANAFKRSGVGYRIYGKMVANANLDLREVGVGYQEISAVVDQDPNMLNDLLFASTGERVDVTTWSMNDIRQYINSHDIYVGTFKPPNNSGQDVQRRKLRVMDAQRRGIFLHPFMAAMYTADFDGDDMEVSLSPQVAELTKDPMDYMVGIDGKQSLNTDFLPVAELVDGYEDGKTARDFVREVMFDGFADGRMISFLVDSVISLGKTAMRDGDAQALAWADVFAEARAVADRTSNGDVTTSNATMSWLCRRVFDTMHRVRVNNTLMTMGAERLENLPSPKSYDDMAIYKIVDDMVEGRVPNNFQELKIMLSGYIGNVKGKNAPFRFTADVGKMIKMDSRIQVGDGSFQVDPDNTEQMTAFFESTIKFVESRRMAKEIKQAGRSKYYTQVMRDLVIKEVKFPENYENYSDFLDAFVRSYAKHSSIINESNLVYLSNMGIASDSNRGLVSPLNPSKGGIRFSDIAEPMLSIYGTYSVGKMFDNLSTSGIMSDRSTDVRWKGTPGHVTKLRRGGDDASSPFEREYEFSNTEFWVNGKYLNYNLRQFRDENRLLRDKERTKRVQAMRLRDAERMSNSEKELWMLLAIADKKTGAASKFNKYVYGFMSKSDDSDEDVSSSRGKTGDNEKNDVQMLSDLLVELDRLDTDGTVSGRRDQMQWINDVVETMIASGPDMFSYFDMDSTAGFLKSEWAKKMMEHRNDVEVLGGIRTSMVFEYRMERINALLADMPSPNDERYPSAYNKLDLAKDELAASSETWRAIIKEMIAEATPGEESVFSQLASGKILKKRSVSGEEYEWVGRKLFDKTREFWKNPGNHTTLRSVIEDTDLDRETKWNVIADVVRYWENDAYFKSWEVGYQLEIGSDSSYSLMSGPGQSMTKMHRDFEKAFNKWGRMSQQKLQEEVDEAAKKYNNAQNKGILMTTLKRLDSHPWERIEIDDGMYADALMSVLDKQYAQTEKASQHPLTNALYAALSFQQNGGYMNDITRTDDRLAGIQSAESVDIGDVVHLLADPEAELWVYDEYGGRCMLTRDIILQNSLNREVGNDVEADVWEFLQKNPRIASAIRRHNACVSASSDGTGYVGAALSLSETIERSKDPDSPINHVKYLMRDHPIYAGIISMASPKHGKVARNERTRTVEIENYLARQIYSYASSETLATAAADAILSDMGITQESIRDAMRSDYDKFLDEMGLPKKYDESESDGDADFTYEVVLSNLARYIDDVRSQVELGVRIEPVQRQDRLSVNTQAKAIRGFHDENDNPIFLSNMYDTPVTFDGITYKNSEAAFQAQKSLDPAVRKRFANLEGKAARKLGRTIKLRPGWDSIKEDIMRQVVHAKFSNPELRRMLEETGNAELIEENTWNDRKWGTVNGNGLNLLGKILMEERGTTEPTYDPSGKPSWLGVDIESVASFWDVLQELGGAKTAVSTGIEGAETYQYAMWASHITARDSYADLEAVFEDVNDQSWDGMWTNLVGPDGTPLVLQVDENGNITNYRQLVRAKKEQGVDEIVTAVPEGYQVRDRSTDSHGTPVSSLFAYMVSKRSNGAEAFNLKAKKAGLDGKDSITKMRGKYRMTDDGRGGQIRANFFDTQWDLQQTAQHEGLPAAKMQLAQMLMQENETLGYDDLTLSNYMSIADLMLIEGEDGVVRLRTLEMLFSAIKHRLGPRVDEMSDAEIRQAADAIVNDRSENGIGMETMDSLDALMGIQPKSKASSFSGIRMASSVFERNYDLLSKIAEKASLEGVMPFSQKKAASMTEAYVDRKKGVRGVREVIDRSEATRNYSVVGFAGAFENAEEINWTIGPSNAVVIGDGFVSDEDVARICDRAYELGMTVVVSSEHRDKIPSDYLSDAMPISVQGDVIIPCFDMRLNGSEASPYDGGQFSIFQVPFSRYVTSVEDSINEHMLGDAQYKPTQALVDRIKVVDNGSKAIKAEDLFPNVFRNPDFKGCTFAVSLLSGSELSRIVANGFECSKDYGIVEGGNGFDQRKHDVDKAIDRYISRWSEATADGMIMEDCAPGDIVAWAEVEIQNPLTGSAPQYVLAPIIPFQLHGPTKNVPESFSVAQVGYVDDDNTLFTVDWTNTTDISNGFAKYFDSSGGANKGMIDFTDAIQADLRLVDGTPVDAYCARESTDSRKIGTDRRIKTMISLMAKARMNGYNFARIEGSFPNMPQIKEQMLAGDRVPRSVWGPLLEWDGPVFCNDPQLDAFLKFECRKVYDNGGNPTDYLMSVYEDENGAEVNTHVMWEFEAMFEQGLNYEDMLLRFLHTMDPTFCPSGIEDDGEYLFRLQRDGADLAHDYDAGVLQMQVPHRMSTGEVRYLWENVYIGMSFFGEDYSGFSRPNVDGASNFLDAMNTMSYYGMELDEKAARFRAMWATADIGRLPKDGGAIGKAPREE